MNKRMNYGWATVACFVLALIGTGCGRKNVTGPDSTSTPTASPTTSRIEWTENGVQKSYTDLTFGVDLTTTPNRFGVLVTSDGIEVIDFEVPYAVGRYMIDASAEMAMGQPGCDVYAAGPDAGGRGWIEITKIETVRGFPAVVEGRFEVTLVDDGYCTSSGPERVCVGSYVASAWE